MAVITKCIAASEGWECRNCCSFCKKKCDNRCLNSADKCGCLRKKIPLTEQEKREKKLEYARAYNLKKRMEDPEGYKAYQREYAKKKRMKKARAAK